MIKLCFEQGTIVVRASDGQRSALINLPGALYDPRIGQFRAPAVCYAKMVATWRELGVDYVDQIREKIEADEFGEFNEVKLRPYQESALQAWTRAEGRGLVVLPTGSGKTRLACAAMATTKVPTLCLVPTRALLHQWRSEIGNFWLGRVGCLGDGQHQLAKITVATYAAAFKQMRQIGDRFGLLIVDEVHHFGGGARDEILTMCVAPRRLGLTATLPDELECQRLGILLGPIVSELKIADLVGSYLADLEMMVLPLCFTVEEQQRYNAALAAFRFEYLQFRAQRGGAPWSHFIEAASKTAAGREALAGFRETKRLINYPLAKQLALGALLQQHRGHRVLIFVADNETAYAVARQHLVMPITCEIGRRERQYALAAFRTGEIDALVSARVLNEGIDVPDADVAIVLGGEQGEREHVQRVGRLLRPRVGKRALVYELVIKNTHEIKKSEQRRYGFDSRFSSVAVA